MGRNATYKEIQLPQLRTFCLVATRANFTAVARMERLDYDNDIPAYSLHAKRQAVGARVRIREGLSAQVNVLHLTDRDPAQFHPFAIVLAAIRAGLGADLAGRVGHESEAKHAAGFNPAEGLGDLLHLRLRSWLQPGRRQVRP